jgi:hypothetical protein
VTPKSNARAYPPTPHSFTHYAPTIPTAPSRHQRPPRPHAAAAHHVCQLARPATATYEPPDGGHHVGQWTPLDTDPPPRPSATGRSWPWATRLSVVPLSSSTGPPDCWWHHSGSSTGLPPPPARLHTTDAAQPPPPACLHAAGLVHRPTSMPASLHPTSHLPHLDGLCLNEI